MTRQSARGPAVTWSQDRVVAGVAADLARRAGVDALVVRMVFIVLTLAGGMGPVAYGLLWLRALTPGIRPAPAAELAPPLAQVGLAVAFLGLLLVLRGIGLWFGDALVVPVLLGAVGSSLIWSRTADAERTRLRGLIGISAASRAPGGPAQFGRVLGGTLLVALAVVALIAANDALVAMRELTVALFAAAVGVALLFGPWALRLVESVDLERRARIREEERGDLAAHLHDSVLQTLALIQRASDEPQRMVALARRQERELRAWLVDGRSGTDDGSLAGALDALAAAVEDAHGVEVAVVRVGDMGLDDRVLALTAAVREAAVNAALHAGIGRVDVFAEVADDEVVVFVRDRGRGFDATSIEPERSGIRHSIRGRLGRHGGRAVLTTEPGEGCEWELAVPRR
jgi:signal transduction histidine kinase/phage shock protein PspC (stress-responsive transcriptional regulator)